MERWYYHLPVRTGIRSEELKRVGQYARVDQYAGVGQYARDGDEYQEKKGRPTKNNIITLNVGGRVYRIKRNVLLERENTLLQKIVKGEERVPCGYMDDTDVYFFDRHPDVFHSVLQFYETGELHVPSHICSKIVKKELNFWNIRDVRMAPCCWKEYNGRITDMSDLRLILTKCALLDYDYSFMETLISGNFSKVYEKLHSTFAVMGAKLPCGKMYNMVFIVITLLNFLLTCCISTLPNRIAHLETTRVYQNRGNITLQEMLVITKPQFMYLGIELLFTIFFVTDQTLRYSVATSTRRFCASFVNFIDLICNIVSILVVVLWFINGFLPEPLELLSHFTRSLRMLRMMRHSRGLMMFIYTVRVRILDVSFMLAIFFVLIVIFGSIMFFSEIFGADLRLTPLINLPTSFYWAGVTITAVGYGKITPISSFSYIIGAIAALSGMIIMFLPIPLIAKQFCLYYEIACIQNIETIPPLNMRMVKRKRLFK